MERVEINLEAVAAPVQAVAAPVAAVAAVAAPVAVVEAAPVQVVQAVAAPVSAAPVQAVAAPVSATFGGTLATGDFLPVDDESEIDNEEIEGKVIANVAMKFWSAFVDFFKIATVKNNADDIMTIKDGYLNLTRSNGVLSANLHQIFGDNEWVVKNPQDLVSKFDLMSGDKVTVRSVGNQNIVYSLKDNEIVNIVPITDTTNDSNYVVAKREFSTPLHTFEIESDVVARLNKAQSVVACDYFSYILDADTYELLSISLNGQFEHRFSSLKGRDTKEFRSQEAFPVKSPKSTTILEIHEFHEEDFKTGSVERCPVFYVKSPVAGIMVNYEFKPGEKVNLSSSGIDADLI